MAARGNNNLPGALEPAVQEKLKAGGITGLGALWREIGKGEIHSGLDEVVAATRAGRRALIRGLMDHVVSQGDEKGKPWPRRHALDLLLIASLIALAWLVWRAVPVARSVGIAERDLAAGERLGAAEIVGADAGSLSDQRTRRPIPKGTYVLPEWLEEVSPAVEEKQLQGRSRISFGVQPEEVERLSDLPALVSLVISSKGGNGKPPATERLWNVPVLAVGEKDSPFITVALTEPQIRKIQPLLPEDKVYVVQPIP